MVTTVLTSAGVSLQLKGTQGWDRISVQSRAAHRGDSCCQDVHRSGKRQWEEGAPLGSRADVWAVKPRSPQMAILQGPAHPPSAGLEAPLPASSLDVVVPAGLGPGTGLEAVVCGGAGHHPPSLAWGGREGQGRFPWGWGCRDEDPLTWDFPGGAVVKNPPANAGDTGLILGPGRSHMPRSN